MLNLAREPFVNERPLRRISAALIGLGVILFLVNAVLFWRYLSGSSELRSQLKDIRASVATERQGISDLERELNAFNLGRQNAQVRFLNQQIKQRKFGWGLLFERMGEVLPRQVRLISLTPQAIDAGRRGTNRDVDSGDTVLLSISGVAADGDQLLDFVDALFDHPAFDSPLLMGENRDASRGLLFQLEATYLPTVDEGVQVTSNNDAEATDDRQALDPSSSTAMLPTDIRPGDASFGEAQSPDGLPRGDGSLVSRQSEAGLDSNTNRGRPAIVNASPQQSASRTTRPTPTTRSDRGPDSEAGSPGSRRRFQPGGGSRQESGMDFSASENDRRFGSSDPSERRTLRVPVMPSRNASAPGGR